MGTVAFKSTFLDGSKAFSRQFLKFGFRFWFSLFQIGVCNPMNGIFDHIQGHFDHVNIDIVHYLLTKFHLFSMLNKKQRVPFHSET